MNAPPIQKIATAGLAAIFSLPLMSGDLQSSQAARTLAPSKAIYSLAALSSAWLFRYHGTQNHNQIVQLTIAEKPKHAEPTKPLIATSPTEKRKPCIKPETVTSLTAWIVAKTGWSAKEPPTIRFVCGSRLAELYYGKDKGPKKVGVKALYGFKTQTIYLSDTWDPNDLRDLSNLLHELVHHLQIANKVEVECEARYELQAYHFQFDWLRERGIQDLYEFLNINQVTVFWASQCPNPYYY